MKLHTLFKSVPSVLILAMSLVFISANSSQAEVVKINPNFEPDPLILKGQSGGQNTTNCGNIGATPSQVIQVTESLPYLRLTVESPGKPTLLIDGPGGRFCVLADSYSGGKPEMSGYWPKGTYSLHVGELAKEEHTYTLSISQQKKANK
ncbi:hypothetical protein QUB80_01455 [Chlorogloeopsis sp. ULAP01]|uniref:hypothetical protein n=1 Tax=Chlorogloeopsis sp. ULAP01 TaxID=3056483 RepID=UPI0025AB0D84|nr:hypothetical protein [Chlorogloeopsis sp. ULAP01]MDM9379373.1 hypothetical protein [Chlorogloeopsis sp. ULAP01]